ncbi:MAG TPA: polyprenol phosphomannose-dependent alpha 1,6 mannosyltransferase MptB [Pseudonocardiaceae bacterium]|nr:polyprenol phosphomannose-dependent alpha 1,6 mannosyltransferase MptB [Pseudonocardiaceae bacterium]
MTFVPHPLGSGSDDVPGVAISRRGPIGVEPDYLPVPVRSVAAGMLGTILVAGGGIGAASVVEPDPVLDGTAFSWLGYGHGKQMSVFVVYVGIALLVWSWVRLGRAARAGAVDRRGVLAAVGAWTLPLLVAPPLFSRDLFTYLAQGDLALHGLNPYHHGVSDLDDHLSANVDPRWQNTPTPYGPLFILVAKSVVLITGQSTVVGVIAMRVTLCVGMVLLCWALPRLAERLGGSPTVALWLGAANPLVLLYLVGGGHNDLLMVGLLAAGTVLVLDGRYRRGFLLVTLALAVKATAGVLLPFLVLVWASRRQGQWGRRLAMAALSAIAVVVPTFAACTLLAGVDLGWLPALSTSNLVIDWLSLPTGAGQLVYIVGGLFGHLSLNDILNVTRPVGWLILVALVVRQWWLARDEPDATVIRRAALALLAVILCSPATLPWYFSWALVIAAGLAWSRRGLVIATGCSTLIALLNLPDGSIGLYKAGYLAAAVLAGWLAAVSLVRPDPLRLSVWPRVRDAMPRSRSDETPNRDVDYGEQQATDTRPPFGGLRAGRDQPVRTPGPEPGA